MDNTIYFESNFAQGALKYEDKITNTKQSTSNSVWKHFSPKDSYRIVFSAFSASLLYFTVDAESVSILGGIEPRGKNDGFTYQEMAETLGICLQ